MRHLSLCSSLLLLGITGLAQAADPVVPNKGALVYARPGSCVTCHQANGAGLQGVFPPLAGSEWLNRDSSVLIKIVLHGLQGPIAVRGQNYTTAMPGMATSLKDDEIADVLNFVQTTWGKVGEPVTAAAVAKIRAAEASRTTMWTGKELRP